MVFQRSLNYQCHYLLNKSCKLLYSVITVKYYRDYHNYTKHANDKINRKIAFNCYRAHLHMKNIMSGEKLVFRELRISLLKYCKSHRRQLRILTTLFTCGILYKLSLYLQLQQANALKTHG